ncbi:hypothetical protein RRG08_044494 [Elysia crispata]|uniref:Uncharacterized protein n=1 Tax=Elysia crispata TaxID=231223 RepID=A0AAE1DEC4_9GAST|nr:hypothetical protein RRG08_044494 [Elysia crispata]
MTRILLTLRRHWPLGLTLVVSYLFTIKADYINQTIASSCDHVTLGVLVADSRQQSKTVVRDSVAVSGETRRHPRYRLTTLKPGETECDVWTLKASDKESNYDNLALTLDSFDLQEHSQVILVAETPRKMRVFRSGQKPPASTLPVRFESTSGLGLIWARSRQPGRDVTKPGRREYLSFSYQAVSEAAGERSLYGNIGSAMRCRLQYGNIGSAMRCGLQYGNIGSAMRCGLQYGNIGSAMRCGLQYGNIGSAMGTGVVTQ